MTASVEMRHRIKTEEDDDHDIDSYFNSTHTSTSPLIQEFEFESPLIGKYIKLKNVKDNNDIIMYQIQSISSPTIEKQTSTIEGGENLPNLVKESTNQWLLLNRWYKCNNTKTQQTDFFIAFIVILLQIISYIAMAYYLIAVYISDLNDRKDSCYGPNCDDTEDQPCMDIKTGSVAAILLIGFLWADFINAFSMIKDSFDGIKLINKLQCIGSVIILIEILSAAICGIVVGIYSATEFDAINGAVGILCVHDLDEKIYSAMDVIESNWKRLLALILWIFISVFIAMSSACINTYRDFILITDDNIGLFLLRSQYV